MQYSYYRLKVLIKCLQLLLLIEKFKSFCGVGEDS